MRRDTFRWALTAFASLAIVVGLLPAGGLPASAAAAPTLAVRSTLDLIRTEDPAPANPTTAISLVAAQNEFESAQLQVRANADPLTGVSVTATNLTGPAGVISSADVTLYRELGYRVATPSDQEIFGATTCTVNCIVPDGLLPARDPLVGQQRNAFPFDVEANRSQTVFVDVLARSGTAAGVYTGSLTVSWTGGSQVVPLTLEVLGFELPSTPSLPMIVSANPNAIVRVCNTTGCNPWEMYDRFQATALNNRFALNLPAFAAPAGGNVANFNKYGLPRLQGTTPTGQPATRLPGARVPLVAPNLWEAGYQDGGGYNVAANNIDDWRVSGDTHGYTDRLTFYCDEMGSNAATWQQFCNTPYLNAKSAWDQAGATARPLPVMATVSKAQLDFALGQGFQVAAALTTLTPNMRMIEASDIPDTSQQYRTWRDADPARKFWFYSACDSVSCNTSQPAYVVGQPTLALDQPPVSMRAPGLQAWRVGATGEYYYEAFLKFGTTAWSCVPPAGGTDCLYNEGGNGDGTLFYYGSAQGAAGHPAIGGTVDIPLETLRLKQIRDAREDYEYLTWLKARGVDPARLNAVGSSIFPTMYSIPSAAAFDGARAQLVALVREQLTADTTARIVYSSTRDGGDKDIFTIRPDGTGATNLTPTAAGQDGQPTWAPDGRRIAFTSDRAGQSDIWVMGADGSNPVNITTGITTPAEKPVWSRDGAEIAFVTKVNGVFEVWTMRPDGSLARKVTTGFDPFWEWGSNTLGYASGTSAFDLHSSYGNVVTPAVEEDNPELSGDQEFIVRGWLAYNRIAPGGNYDVVVQEIRNEFFGAPVNLTVAGDGATAHDYMPTWSPDSERLAFVSNRQGATDLWQMARDGSGPVRITNDAGVESDPDWGPMPLSNDGELGAKNLNLLNATMNQSPPPATASVSADGTLVGATSLVDEYPTPNSSVWYSFTAPVAGDYRVSVAATQFNPRLFITADPLAQYDGPSAAQTVTLTAGAKRWFVVDTADGRQGAFTITVQRVTNQRFLDVPPGRVFYDEIDWLAARGVTNGWAVPGGREFRPLEPVNRDAMAAFMYRLSDSPAYTPPAVSPFLDVAPSHPFYKEIAWLSEQGVSTGWAVPGGREFRPHEPVNRDAMAAFMYRLASSPAHTAPATSPFLDVPVSQPFYREITWLSQRGISTGWAVPGGREFRPVTHVNRDAMAAFMYRYAQP